MIAIFNPQKYACNCIRLFLILFTLLASLILHSQQLSFPTAKGAGAYALGGRGGSVVHVTNLNDSGPGSFRDALGDNRTIVFDVSGVINLTNPIDTIVNNITIAGQTSPGEGVTFIGETVVLKQLLAQCKTFSKYTTLDIENSYFSNWDCLPNIFGISLDSSKISHEKI